MLKETMDLIDLVASGLQAKGKNMSIDKDIDMETKERAVSLFARELIDLAIEHQIVPAPWGCPEDREIQFTVFEQISRITHSYQMQSVVTVDWYDGADDAGDLAGREVLGKTFLVYRNVRMVIFDPSIKPEQKSEKRTLKLERARMLADSEASR